MWTYLLIGSLLGLLVYLNNQGFFSAASRRAAALYVRAALTPLTKRGWQKDAGKEGFKLNPIDVSYPFTMDLERLANYIVVCQIPNIDKFGQVPILFPEAMCISSELLEVLLGPEYPIPVLGSVHVRNWTRQERAIRSDENLTMTVKVLPDVVAVKRGSEVTTELILTDMAGKAVWTSRLVYLAMHRHRKTPQETPKGSGQPLTTVDATKVWSLPENMGRVYGVVSMDVNPIHLHAIAAKAFGFPRAIAHGMYTAARAFSACQELAQQDIDFPIEAEVFFKSPVMLPSKSELRLKQSGKEVKFSVTAAGGERLLLEGSVKGY